MADTCIVCDNAPRFVEEANARVCAVCVLAFKFTQGQVDLLTEHAREMDSLRQQLRDVERERDGLRNDRDHYRQVFGQVCAHVAEACEMLGNKPSEYPPDSWTLREMARRVVDQLRDAESAALRRAAEVCKQLAADFDERAGGALAGSNSERHAVAGSVACQRAAHRILSLAPTLGESDRRGASLAKGSRACRGASPGCYEVTMNTLCFFCYPNIDNFKANRVCGKHASSDVPPGWESCGTHRYLEPDGACTCWPDGKKEPFRANTMMPWEGGPFREWSIVGMNHYEMKGVRYLFVAMTNKNNQCIRFEADNEFYVFARLAEMAAEINKAERAL